MTWSHGFTDILFIICVHVRAGFRAGPCPILEFSLVCLSQKLPLNLTQQIDAHQPGDPPADVIGLPGPGWDRS